MKSLEMEKRNILLVFGGSIIGLGAGILGYWLYKQHKSSKKYKEFDEDLRKLGEIRREGEDKLIQVHQFHKLKCILEKHLKRSAQMNIKQLILQRREMLIERKKKEYAIMCLSSIEYHDSEAKGYCERMKERIKVREEEFNQTLEENYGKPQFRLLENQREARKLKKLEIPGFLTKELTIEMCKRMHMLNYQIREEDPTIKSAKEFYLYVQEYVLSSTKSKLKKAQLKEFVSQIFLFDYLFNEFQVTEDQFNKAYSVFRLEEIPEIQHLIDAHDK